MKNSSKKKHAEKDLKGATKMSEDEATEKLKRLVARCKECKFATCENCEINWNEAQAIETILDLYQKEKEKNKSYNTAYSLGKAFEKQRQNKMIELLISDLQMEGCLIDMTKEEIYRYYDKRILLDDKLKEE